MTLSITDVTTISSDSSSGRPDTSSDRTRTAAADNRTFISFPKDLDKLSDSTSESGFRDIPYVKMTIFEIQPGGAADLSDPTSRSIAEGAGAVVGAITSGPGATLVGAGIAARLQLGTAATVIAGTAAATAAGTGVLDAGGLADDAVSSLLNLDGKTIGERFKENLRGFGIRRNTQNIQKYILLPVPENIGVSYDQTYLEVGLTQSFGLPGLLAQGFSQQAKNISGGMDPYALEVASTIAQSIPGVGSNADRVLFFGTSGLVVNPQLEMLFAGTALRRFILDFKLTPKNAEDARALFDNNRGRGVISALKYYSAPIIPNNSTGRYFIPPAQFELEFYLGGNKKNSNMFKTKKCVLTSVAVDYTPNGYTTHEDGTPAQVTLQLQFTETSIISRSDYESGGIR